jgi:hypothetical protein
MKKTYLVDAFRHDASAAAVAGVAESPAWRKLQADLTAENPGWRLLDQTRHFRLKADGSLPADRIALPFKRGLPGQAAGMLNQCRVVFPEAQLVFKGFDGPPPGGKRLFCVLAWWNGRPIVFGLPESMP